uniref:SHSP domain-containing protein n=1 Tax=Caenorhabditis tropicalis TaxID=1561998 RepID=A0A1I7UVS1_9PELO
MSLYHYYRPSQRSLFNELMKDFGLIERQFIPNSGDRTTSSEIVNNDEKFGINLNVSQFKPEDLKINLDGRTLTIQGDQEVKTENGYSKKSFSRVILLPEDVDASKVASNLSEDGKLSIEAPKKESIQGRSIPIQQTAAVEEKPAQ